MYDRETGAQQFRGLVMGEIHRKPSQKSGTSRKNRSVPDLPDLSPSFPDNRGYLRFLVFISRQNLGQLGNRKISNRLGYSRHVTALWASPRFGHPHSQIPSVLGIPFSYYCSVLGIPRYPSGMPKSLVFWSSPPKKCWISRENRKRFRDGFR